MNNYVTGSLIKKLREEKNLTQEELANILLVSAKTISKWETGRGFPDISLIEPLSKALGVSVIELINGDNIINNNRSANMLKSKFYVCPICGNISFSVGNNVVSCCGINLPNLEIEDNNNEHQINFELIEDELFVSINHPMHKNHYIEFVAYVTNDRIEMVHLYPEQSIEVRFLKRGHGFIYAYCIKDGLFKVKI